MAKTIGLLKELERYPVFNNKIVRDITKKESSYAKLLVQRLKKKNLIYPLGRDRYTLQKDPLVIASHIVWPCYISLWTALRYHNLTEQLPEVIWLITTRQKRGAIKLKNAKIRFVIVKPKFFFGYRKESYNGFDIFIAEPEKAVIDALALRRVSASEIFDIIMRHAGEIESGRILNYLLILNNRSIAKRLGYMLDKAGRDYFNALAPLISGKYVALDTAMPKKGKRNRKWKVIENVKQ
ncbi:MAG: hypothetical protein KJ955_08705 [Nanoarchaeota archaeon]|nr:hypothetical protein [Nanoarchaeota archaeon]